MRITIVGAGRIGIHLAKYFSEENQDVFLVDNDKSHLASLESDFNLRTFLGEPTDFQTLRSANAEKADVFISVTADTPENLVACALAKSMGAKKTIARVDKYDFLESKNLEVVRNMGVDHVVFPDYLSACSVISSLEHPWCNGWSDFNGGEITMIAVTVNEDSPIAGQYLKEIYQEDRLMHISALKRDSQTIIPRGDDIIKPKDILYITTTSEGVERVRKITGKKSYNIRNVILMGGSSVAELTARMASEKFSFTIIEKNIERCRRLTELCSETEIINGDGSEQDVLEEAGINNCDAFVALTDSSESNIIGCLTAEDAGVARTVAEVEKEQFIGKAEAFRIGGIINKPIIAANAIFQIVLDSDPDSSRIFAMKDAEVANMEIKPGSRFTEYAVKDLKLPRELTFAGLIRNGKGEIVTGNTVFQPGDNVIVFCLKGSLAKVEKLFKK